MMNLQLVYRYNLTLQKWKFVLRKKKEQNDDKKKAA